MFVQAMPMRVPLLVFSAMPTVSAAPLQAALPAKRASTPTNRTASAVSANALSVRQEHPALLVSQDSTLTLLLDVYLFLLLPVVKAHQQQLLLMEKSIPVRQVAQLAVLPLQALLTVHPLTLAILSSVEFSLNVRKPAKLVQELLLLIAQNATMVKFSREDLVLAAPTLMPSAVLTLTLPTPPLAKLAILQPFTHSMESLKLEEPANHAPFIAKNATSEDLATATMNSAP